MRLLQRYGVYRGGSEGGGDWQIWMDELTANRCIYTMIHL